MASSATQTFPCLEGIFTKPKGFCFAVFACISCFICCERLETFGPSKSMCRSMGFGLLGLAFLAPYNLKQLIDQVASLACSKSAAGAAGSSAFPCCGTARRTFVQVPATSLQSLERFGCGKKRERERSLWTWQWCPVRSGRAELPNSYSHFRMRADPQASSALRCFWRCFVQGCHTFVPDAACWPWGVAPVLGCVPWGLNENNPLKDIKIKTSRCMKTLKPLTLEDSCSWIYWIRRVLSLWKVGKSGTHGSGRERPGWQCLCPHDSLGW